MYRTINVLDARVRATHDPDAGHLGFITVSFLLDKHRNPYPLNLKSGAALPSSADGIYTLRTLLPLLIDASVDYAVRTVADIIGYRNVFGAPLRFVTDPGSGIMRYGTAERPFSRGAQDTPRLFSQRLLVRHNLNRVERRELADMVANYLRDDGSVYGTDIAEFLNDCAAAARLWLGLPGELKDTLIYGECGHWTVRDDAFISNNGRICHNCADGDWVVPEDSDVYYHIDDLYYSEIFGAYFTCDHDEGDDDDCDYVSSWNTSTTGELNAPEITSRSDGDFTIGVEFECDPRNYDSRRKLAQHVYDDFEGLAMCKGDGSLSNTGIEVILAPLTLERAKSTLNSIDFPSSTRAWDAGNCGLHVHIDSRAFNQLTLAKFIGFWNAKENARFIRSIAGRHSDFDSQASEFAKAIYDGSDNEMTQHSARSIVRKVKNSTVALSRYRLTNLTPLGESECERLGVPYTGESRQYNTVELRGFRATMNKKRRDAQIEMAHATVVYTRTSSARDMSSKAFVQWLRTDGARYPALRAWLGITKHKDAPGRTSSSPETGDRNRCAMPDVA